MLIDGTGGFSDPGTTLSVSGELAVGGSSSVFLDPYLLLIGGATAASSSGVIGKDSEVGSVAVFSYGSQWTSGDLQVGEIGRGNLHIDDGGKVISETVHIGGENTGSVGVSSSVSSVSIWNTGDLSVGTDGAGIGVMGIGTGGLVNVRGTLTILETGEITMDGGQLTFTQTSLPEFDRIELLSASSVAGNVIHFGYTDVATVSNSSRERVCFDLVADNSVSTEIVITSPTQG